MQVQWVQVSHRHLHRQKDTKLYYVISMKHLLKKAKRKLLKVFRRRLPEANCQKKRQKLLSARSQQVLEINVQTAI